MGGGGGGQARDAKQDSLPTSRNKLQGVAWLLQMLPGRTCEEVAEVHPVSQVPRHKHAHCEQHTSTAMLHEQALLAVYLWAK